MRKELAAAEDGIESQDLERRGCKEDKIWIDEGPQKADEREI
jgi:hypothetical protein